LALAQNSDVDGFGRTVLDLADLGDTAEGEGSEQSSLRPKIAA
jgi:hypothetical protein